MRNGVGVNGYDGRRESGSAELKRVEAPYLPLAERKAGFSEVELCFSDEQGKAETHRCLQCDLEICVTKKARIDNILKYEITDCDISPA